MAFDPFGDTQDTPNFGNAGPTWYHDLAKELIRTRGKRLIDNCAGLPTLGIQNRGNDLWYLDLAREGVRTKGRKYFETIPALWIQPSDTTRQTQRYGAKFTGGDNQNYLTVADHTDFDFSGGNKSFTIVINRNPTVDPNGSGDPGTVRTYCGQNRNTANGGGWWLNSGSGAGQSERVYAWFAATTDGNTTLTYRGTATDGLRWSCCVMTYAAGAVKIYLDGIEYSTIGTYDDSGTIPTTPLNPSAIGYSIGREGHGAHRDAIDILHDNLVIKGRAWTQADVTEYWNNGVILPYAQLSTNLKTSVVRSYGLNNSLADDLGGASLSEVGTVPFAIMVTELRDKGLNGHTLYPCRYSAVADYSIKGYSAAPRYLATGINSTPALEYHYNHWLYSAHRMPFRYGTADFFEVQYWTEIPAGEQFTILSADEASTNAYFMTGYTPNSAKNKPSLRIKDTTGAVGDNHIYADIDLQGTTPYIIWWRMIGSGGTSSVVCRVNGVQQTLAYGSTAVHNVGPDSVRARDNLTIAALTRTSGPDPGPFNALLGEQMVYSPGLSEADGLLIEAYIAAAAGISI